VSSGATTITYLEADPAEFERFLPIGIQRSPLISK